MSRRASYVDAAMTKVEQDAAALKLTFDELLGYPPTMPLRHVVRQLSHAEPIEGKTQRSEDMDDVRVAKKAAVTPSPNFYQRFLGRDAAQKLKPEFRSLGEKLTRYNGDLDAKGKLQQIKRDGGVVGLPKFKETLNEKTKKLELEEVLDYNIDFTGPTLPTEDGYTNNGYRISGANAAINPSIEGEMEMERAMQDWEMELAASKMDGVTVSFDIELLSRTNTVYTFKEFYRIPVSFELDSRRKLGTLQQAFPTDIHAFMHFHDLLDGTDSAETKISPIKDLGEQMQIMAASQVLSIIKHYATSLGVFAEEAKKRAMAQAAKVEAARNAAEKKKAERKKAEEAKVAVKLNTQANKLKNAEIFRQCTSKSAADR